MAIKRDKIVTDIDGFLSIKPNDAFIKWFCEIRQPNQTIISNYYIMMVICIEGLLQILKSPYNVCVRIKILPWKFCIFNSKGFRAIQP